MTHSLNITLQPALRKDIFLAIFLVFISYGIFKAHPFVWQQLMILSETFNFHVSKRDFNLGVGACTILPLIVLFFSLMSIFMTSYAFSEKRVIFSKGVLNRTSDPIEYYRIKDVVIEQPLHYQALGLMRLRIISTDRTVPLLLLDGIKKNDGFHIEPVLREQIELATNSGKGRELEVL